MRTLWRLRYTVRGRVHYAAPGPLSALPVPGRGWRDVTLQKVEVER